MRNPIVTTASIHELQQQNTWLMRVFTPEDRCNRDYIGELTSTRNAAEVTNRATSDLDGEIVIRLNSSIEDCIDYLIPWYKSPTAPELLVLSGEIVSMISTRDSLCLKASLINFSSNPDWSPALETITDWRSIAAAMNISIFTNAQAFDHRRNRVRLNAVGISDET